MENDKKDLLNEAICSQFSKLNETKNGEEAQKCIDNINTLYRISTVMFRQIICKDALDTLFYNVPVEMTDIYKETMGITISLFDKNISSAVCMAILAAFGIAFIIAGILITKHLRKMGNK